MVFATCGFDHSASRCGCWVDGYIQSQADVNSDPSSLVAVRTRDSLGLDVLCNLFWPISYTTCIVITIGRVWELEVRDGARGWPSGSVKFAWLCDFAAGVEICSYALVQTIHPALVARGI